MRRFWILGLLLVVVLVVASGATVAESNFRATLSSGEEVAAVPIVSNARGQAVFQLSEDGTELYYKLIVANIDNVRASHIHLAQPGVNGGVVVFLAGPFPDGGGRFDGVLAEGVITSADLINALAGQDLSVLIEHMESGNAYVNVHTTVYPGGEIRGQIH